MRERAFLLVLSLLWLASFAACRPVTPERGPAKTNEPVGLEQALRAGQIKDFRLKEKDAGRASTQFTFTNADSFLKIEVFPGLDTDAAQSLLQDGIMGLQALYAHALSPYPGDISHRLQTNPKFRPQFFTNTARGVTYSYFLLFANDRFGYGATTEDLLRHKSLLGWFHYGPAGNFYKVRLFQPLATENRALEEFFLSLGCP